VRSSLRVGDRFLFAWRGGQVMARKNRLHTLQPIDLQLTFATFERRILLRFCAVAKLTLSATPTDGRDADPDISGRFTRYSEKVLETSTPVRNDGPDKASN
jgi:hypothetical protein